jgi:Flp pilus assembly protein TadG
MMLRKMQKKNGQRGLAAVEFGLIMPVVIVILYAIFEFGMAFWRKEVLVAAVREGARKGIVATNPKKTKTEIETAVKTYLTGVGFTDSGRTATATGAGGASGTNLTVTATYPTSFLILSRLPLGSGVDSKVNGSGNMTLRATVTMQME